MSKKLFHILSVILFCIHGFASEEPNLEVLRLDFMPLEGMLRDCGKDYLGVDWKRVAMRATTVEFLVVGRGHSMTANFRQSALFAPTDGESGRIYFNPSFFQYESFMVNPLSLHEILGVEGFNDEFYQISTLYHAYVKRGYCATPKIRDEIRSRLMRSSPLRSQLDIFKGDMLIASTTTVGSGGDGFPIHLKEEALHLITSGQFDVELQYLYEELELKMPFGTFNEIILRDLLFVDVFLLYNRGDEILYASANSLKREWNPFTFKMYLPFSVDETKQLYSRNKTNQSWRLLAELIVRMAIERGDMF
ncbi:MAG: hypothetical protein AAF203_04705 [Pseudomonadota bacterium]